MALFHLAAYLWVQNGHYWSCQNQAILAVFAMVCGLNCILFILIFLDTVSGFISHYWCLNRLSRPASLYSEFSVIFKARFVIRAAADQFLPCVLPRVLEHIHCLIFQNTGLVSAAGRASNLAQTDISHSCISYVCSATGLVFVQQLWSVNYVKQLQPFIYNFVEWYWLVNIDAFPKASTLPLLGY
jgi:hypothetical protein